MDMWNGVNSEIIKLWELNQYELEKDIDNGVCDIYNYADVVEAVAKYILRIQDPIIKEEWIGDYQGSINYEITDKESDETYCTSVTYGSCSLCDTMMYIDDYIDNNYEKTQAYMRLALNIVQSIW